MSSSPNKKMKFSQNKAKYYGKSQRQQSLAPGIVGFLATCNFREKDCLREAYNVLNHYADEMYGPEEEEKVENAEKTEDLEACSDDIADQLTKEVTAAKTKQRKAFKRFQQIVSGANNCIFIRTTLENPVELASRIVSDIKSTGEQKTRFLLRLLPIESVCRYADIIPVAGALFDKYFLKTPSTFSIIVNRRLNNVVKRDDIIAELADLVHSKNVANKVDLKNAKRTIVVEIIKNFCLLSVIPDYLKYKKFNLVEIATSNKPEKAENEASTENDKEKAYNSEVKDNDKTVEQLDLT